MSAKQSVRVPTAPGSREPSPAVSALTGFDPSRVTEVLADGDGFWRTCSGCYETEDGYDVGHYPHSDLFGCKMGGGCGDCGGLGVVWDNIDYDDMARWSLERDAETDHIRLQLRRLGNGICDVLSKLKSRSVGSSPKGNAYAYAEVPDWLLRQWLERATDIDRTVAQGMSTRSAETEGLSPQDASPVREANAPEPEPSQGQSTPSSEQEE